MAAELNRYHYVARDRYGKLIKGVMFANNEEECSLHIRSKQLYLLQLKAVVKSKKSWFKTTRMIGYAEVATFCKQFSALLKAGIPIPQALRLMCFQKTVSEIQIVISETLLALQKGESLYQGLVRHQGKFPPFFCSLVKAGEETGALDVVFERLAVFYDQEDQFRKQLAQSMVYPLLLLGSTVCVVVFLFLKIIPGFAEIYEGLEARLPLLTYCLLSISQYLKMHFTTYLIGFPLFVFSLSYIYKIPKVKAWFLRLQYHLPIWGNMKKRLLTARLARTWNLLLANGVEVLPAVELTVGTVDLLVDKYLRQIVQNVQQGITFSGSLHSTGFFPELFLEMVEIGEESGALAAMLARSAEMFEQEGRDQIQRLLTMLEPALLLGIALIVGLIVLSVMLPMFDLLKVF